VRRVLCVVVVQHLIYYLVLVLIINSSLFLLLLPLPSSSFPLQRYSGIETERIQGIMSDTSVNLTYRRRAGKASPVRFPDEGARFEGTNPHLPPPKRIRVGAVDASAQVNSGSAENSDAEAPAGGEEKAGGSGGGDASTSSSSAAASSGAQPAPTVQEGADHAKFMGILEEAVREAVRGKRRGDETRRESKRKKRD
jgi:hypothetical protein